MPSKNPSKKHLLLENLLRTPLRSVLLYDPVGVHPRKGAQQFPKVRSTGSLRGKASEKSLRTPRRVLQNPQRDPCGGLLEPLRGKFPHRALGRGLTPPMVTFRNFSSIFAIACCEGEGGSCLQSVSCFLLPSLDALPGET